ASPLRASRVGDEVPGSVSDGGTITSPMVGSMGDLSFELLPDSGTTCRQGSAPIAIGRTPPASDCPSPRSRSGVPHVLSKVVVRGRKVLVPQVHHVPATVGLEREPVRQLPGAVHVPHGVLRREVVSTAVVVPGLNHRVQLWVLSHCEAEILSDCSTRVVPGPY